MMSVNEGSAVNAAVTSSVTKESVLSLLDQLKLARAAELARAGHYAEAEEVLSAGRDETRHGAASLDLLARMRAQQGRLEEAEKLWTRASLLDPANPAYGLALRRAAQRRRGSRRPAFVLSLVACGLICALAGFWLWQRRPSTRGDANAAASAPTSQRRSDATPGPPPAPPQRPPAAVEGAGPVAALAPAENGINVSGVTVTRVPDGLTLSFDDGLFRRGLTLKPGARERLRELGRQLEPFGGDVAIRIIGTTDELPMPRRARYRDNVSLGMERARFVYDYLRLTSKLDSHGVTIGSGGGRQTPDDSARAADRARSRTVVVHLGAR